MLATVYPVAVWLMVAVSFVVSLSTAPLTVTVCAILQVAVVKVNVAGLNVTSVLLLDGVTTALPLGAVFNFTV